MKIYAYGDSFVAGDQDIPGRVDAIFENMEWNRYNVSFASFLAKKLDCELINKAVGGSGNYPQLDILWTDSPNIRPEDLVIFGFTSSWRDRFSIPLIWPGAIAANRGPTMLDRNLLQKNEQNRIAVVDFFYVLSVIEKIEELYGFKVIKFNNFHNVLDEATEQDRSMFKFKNFIGLHEYGNTLIDVLSDNWGNKDNNTQHDHTKWVPLENYKHLFTSNSHPSLAGHEKISHWLHDQLIINKWI